MWNKHLEILIHCWIIWKWQNCLPSPPRGTSFWWPILSFWPLNLAFPHVGESPNLPHRGVACVALLRAFPQKQGISFLSLSPWLNDIWPVFLMLYSAIKTALLLILFSRKVMPNLCCVAQKPASLAQLRFKNNFFSLSLHFENNFLCRGSCFFGYTAENSHHLKAWITSKNLLFQEVKIPARKWGRCQVNLEKS